MTRIEEAIEALEYLNSDDCTDTQADYRDDIAVAIEALKKQHEWISVDDKLPGNDRDVLCWYEYFRYGDYNCMYATYGIGCCIGDVWCGEVAQGAKAKVLFWQPLPEPPEEDNA